MQLYDSHCHLNHPEFDSDYHKHIQTCLEKRIGLFIIGNDFATSRRATEIAEEYVNENVYASVGVHPDDYVEEGFNQDQFQLLINDKVKAIGEIGLDYSRTTEAKETQKKGFIEQLNFAKENKLPVVLHARGSQQDSQDAYLDMLEILREQNFNHGVIHCFSANSDIAKKFVELGFFIGFTGLITFKNKALNELREVVKELPLEKILVETDAPFLAPDPHRGQLCLPEYVELVAEKVAQIKQIDIQTVQEKTTQNFNTLFL